MDKKKILIISLSAAAALVILLTVILCVVLIKPDYTVKFNSDGAGEIADQIVRKGNLVTEPDSPEKEGFVFEGWYLNEKEWDFTKDVVKKNMTLKAKWGIAYKVSFMNGNVTVLSKWVGHDSVTCGDLCFGYNSNVIYYEDAECQTEFDFTKPITENTTIYTDIQFKNIATQQKVDVSYEDMFYFSLIDEEHYSIDMKGYSELFSMIIPEKYNDKEIVAIGYGTDGLEYCNSVYIPKNIEKIEFYSFYGCAVYSNLSEADCDYYWITDYDDSNNVEDCDALLYYDVKKAFVQIDNIIYAVRNNDAIVTGVSSDEVKDVVIPASITYNGKELPVSKVGAFAFDSTAVENVTISEGVVEIGICAFEGSDLKSISIPASVTKIDSCAFQYCYALETVTFASDSRLEVLGDYVFFDCDSLLDLNIPSSIKQVGEAILNWEWVENNEDYVLIDNGVYYIGNEENPHLILWGIESDATSCEIHKDTRIILDSAFWRCENETITIPSNVVYIGNNAFEQSKLIKVAFEENSQLQVIGECAFQDCNALESLELPESVELIKKDAFNECDSLKIVTIPNSQTIIEERAFSYCYALEGIEYDNAIYMGLGNNPYYFLLRAKDENITSCIIHEDTKVIADHAFKYCGALENLVIPNGVIEIGGYAISQCASLKTITIPNSVKILGNGAIGRNNQLEEVIFEDGSKAEILNSTFEDNNALTKVDFGKNSCIKALDYTFSGCSALEEITIPASVESMYYTFDNCTSLKEVKFEEGIKCYYMCYTFNYCSSLKSIVLPNIMGDAINAFSNCTNLETIYLERFVEPEWIKIKSNWHGLNSTQVDIVWNYKG